MITIAILTLPGCGSRDHKVIINEIDKEHLLDYHNMLRESSDEPLPILQIDKELQDGAQEWAEYMAKKDRLRHDNLSHSSFNILGENIAYGQRSVQQVMDSWMNSSGHRRNIMNKKFTHVGFGVARQEDGTMFWCVKFGG